MRLGKIFSSKIISFALVLCFVTQLSANDSVVGESIHFQTEPKSPMMFVISNGILTASNGEAIIKYDSVIGELSIYQEDGRNYNILAEELRIKETHPVTIIGSEMAINQESKFTQGAISKRSCNNEANDVGDATHRVAEACTGDIVSMACARAQLDLTIALTALYACIGRGD